MLTKVKSFMIDAGELLDDKINEWVDETKNYIVDVKTHGDLPLGHGRLLVIVTYMTHEDITAMIMPLGGGAFVDFEKGKDGSNILDLSQFEDDYDTKPS